MSRRGASLLEALVAVAIVGAPLVSCLGLIVSNTRGTQHNLDHVTAEMYLQDVLEVIASTVSTPGDLETTSLARDTLRERAALLEDAPSLRRRLDALAETLKVRLDRDCGSATGTRYPDRGYGPGLHRIELSVTLENGAVVRAARFVQQPPVPGPGHS